MATIELVQRDPKELKNYPLNISLYREHIDADFVESIRSKGIQSPLTVCKSSNPNLNDFIVMGRRRRIAAMTCKMKTVPCIVWECDDPLEFEERLILDNIRNETTVEERARMYEELLRIETEKAERRQKAGKKESPDLTEKVPQGTDSTKQGEKKREAMSSEKAASQVGMSNKTADKALEVVHAADEMEAEGKVEEAAEIRETLNTQSVAAAARKVDAVVNPKPPVDEHTREITKHVDKLASAIAAAEKATEEAMKSIDAKCAVSEAMRNRKKRFETLLRRMAELLDPCLNHASAISKAWGDAKGQVDA